MAGGAGSGLRVLCKLFGRCSEYWTGSRRTLGILNDLRRGCEGWIRHHMNGAGNVREDVERELAHLSHISGEVMEELRHAVYIVG